MAYSADAKVKVIANIGRQMLTDGGWMLIYDAIRVSDGKKVVLWTRTIVAGGVTQRSWFYRTKTNITQEIAQSIRSIIVDPQVDFTNYLDDAQPDFVSGAADAGVGRVLNENIVNDAGNRVLNTVDTAGNLKFGDILGDGVAVYPYAVATTVAVTDPTSPLYVPPKATANAGIFAPITDFISQNPLTSTVIGIGIAIGLYWAYNEYEESKGKGKKKRRRG